MGAVLLSILGMAEKVFLIILILLALILFFPVSYKAVIQKHQEQFYVLDAIHYSQNIPSLSQAQQFKKSSQEGTLTPETANATMLQDKKPALDKFSFKGEKFRKFFPKNYTQDQMEAVIIKLLKKWQLQHSHSQEL